MMKYKERANEIVGLGVLVVVVDVFNCTNIILLLLLATYTHYE